jgi:hypothetical protein
VIITDFLTVATGEIDGLLVQTEIQADREPIQALKRGQGLRPVFYFAGVAAAVFIFNSLIQISSSSKGDSFLWTARFLCLVSTAWRLFNHLARRYTSSRRNMNNFTFCQVPVDKS